MADPAKADAALTPRRPMLVTCTACRHVWPAAWLPMVMALACKAMRCRCPNCGVGANKAVPATFEAGDLHRYVEHLAAELRRAESELASLASQRATIP